jgi:exodeoxyribonuclease VII small subunit
MAITRRKFEDELKDLEAIVAQIDSGEPSLEDSIAAFERGVGLVRALNQKLDEVERKVELLMRNAQGELKTTPYDPALAKGEKEDEANKDGHKKDDEDIPF